VFEQPKELYEHNQHFMQILEGCRNPKTFDKIMELDYSPQGGYLFKIRQFCILKYSLHENLIKNLHGIGLGRYYGRYKTQRFLEEK
jgi:hypothetical protein